MKKSTKKACVLPLLMIGHPTLRKIAEPVPPLFSRSATRSFADDMLATCQAHNGVGISAPQVGRSLRVCIIASRPNPRYPDAPLVEPIFMINPKIEQYTVFERVDGIEGCLSIPGLFGTVKRPRGLLVSWTDLTGKRTVKNLSGFLARIFCHELDHLNGVLFTDHAPRESFVHADELRRQEEDVKLKGHLYNR